MRVSGSRPGEPCLSNTPWSSPRQPGSAAETAEHGPRDLRDRSETVRLAVARIGHAGGMNRSGQDSLRDLLDAVLGGVDLDGHRAVPAMADGAFVSAGHLTRAVSRAAGDSPAAMRPQGRALVVDRERSSFPSPGVAVDRGETRAHERCGPQEIEQRGAGLDLEPHGSPWSLSRRVSRAPTRSVQPSATGRTIPVAEPAARYDITDLSTPEEEVAP